MRDWTRIDGYLTSLIGDIYLQPEDEGHSGLAKLVIDTWFSRLLGCKTVLDVGCGTGFCQPLFEAWDVQYEGVCLGGDYLIAREKGRNVKKMDFSFLEYEDNSFDLVFSRHSLEHSPMPLLTMMEWRRVAKNWVGIVLPAPEWYTYKGQNHYSVMNLEQIRVLADRAGLNVLWDEVDSRSMEVRKDDDGHIVYQSPPIPHEYWLFCEKRR